MKSFKTCITMMSYKVKLKTPSDISNMQNDFIAGSCQTGADISVCPECDVITAKELCLKVQTPEAQRDEIRELALNWTTPVLGAAAVYEKYMKKCDLCPLIKKKKKEKEQFIFVSTEMLVKNVKN